MSFNFRLFAVLLFSLVFLQQQPLRAQLTAIQKKETIDTLLLKLQEYYIFPEVAGNMADKIRQQQSRKVYDSITDPDVLAAFLTRDLRSVSHDLHISVRYSPEDLPQDLEPMKMPAKEIPLYGKYLQHDNYGIGKVDVLKGNIGYIDFKYLCSPAYAGDTYAAMMNYIAHTDALIIDLRNCHGSASPDAIPMLLSYFFDQPVHLNDWYWRKGNLVQQAWTYAYVPGKKYLQKPVYALTSSQTFSGAEEMAYDLKNLKRAMIIGEKTRGGANPGGDVYVTSHFSLAVPVGKAINPVTKTNWEGIGVQPDTLMPAELALHAAQWKATRYMMDHINDNDWKHFLEGTLADLEKNKPVLTEITFELKGFQQAKEVFVTGSFNSWSPMASPMKKENGIWRYTATTAPGTVTYKFIVDGIYITDPGNAATVTEGAFTNSVKTVPLK